MSKRTVGIYAGLAALSAAVLASPVTGAMASGAGVVPAAPSDHVAPASAALAPDGTVTGVARDPFAASALAVTTAPKQVAPASVRTTATTAKPKPKPAPKPAAKPAAKPKPKPVPKPAPKPPVYKLVRLVKLELPTSATVGANVTGFIQVLDDNGQVQSPVANAEVAFQRKDGARWTDLTDDLTDDNGILPVAFMSQTNMTVRAVLKPAKGKAVYTKQQVVTATTQVTWAARPDFEVAVKTPVTYSFRVNGGFVPMGHLEFASTAKPGKWTSARNAVVDSQGVVKASVTFPAAGTYLLRGTTAKSTTNAAGYTSTIEVTVG